jgi:hypothetical protein
MRKELCEVFVWFSETSSYLMAKNYYSFCYEVRVNLLLNA